MRIGIFAAVAVLALTAPAVAQPAGSSQKADELFNQGRDLLEAGKFKEACARFEASLLEADALGTRLNLALCMEKRGKIRSAVLKFEDTAARADKEGVVESAKVAREHADKLRPLVPKLVIQTTPVPGQRIVITRPGEPEIEVVGPDPVLVDPTDPNDPTDRITITVQAAGYAAYNSEPRQVAPKAIDTIVVPELSKIPEGEPRPVPAPTRSRKKLYGIISASAGVVMIAGAALWASSLGGDLTQACKDAPEECSDGSPYDGHAHDLWVKQRYIATPIFAVGIAAVGFGAFLYFTAPSAQDTSTTAVVPTVNGDGGGIAVRGHF